MAKFKIQKAQYVNASYDATQSSTGIGGVGGDIGITGTQVAPNVWPTGASVGSQGSILRSKGKGKFLVADSSGTKIGVCTLVDGSMPLAVGQMTLVANTGVVVSNAYVTKTIARLTNKFAIDFTGAKYIWSLTQSDSANNIVQIPGA